MSTEQDITHNIQAINPNLEKLKQAFPHCFDKNGAFDFAKFKAELDSNDINIAKEGYSLDWLGKSYARILASDAATTLLKEDEIHNAKPENINSQNLLIKGDNLEVLKHLSNAYYEKVKMIYIDPPYNTGSDGFVYNDDRKFTAKQLQELAGVSEDEAKRILEFTQSNSNSHSAWLTFMYPRLYIAKQLLKDDGVIFVSIDDNEVAQLRLLMDEIFGEENFVNQFIWVNNLTGRQLSGSGAAGTREFILVYGKTVEQINEFTAPLSYLKKIMPDTYKNSIKDIKIDEIGEYVIGDELKNNNSSFNEVTRPNLVFDIYYRELDREIKIEPVSNNHLHQGFIKISPHKNSNGVNKYHAYRWSKEKILREKENLEFIKYKDTFKVYPKRRDFENSVVKDLITNIPTSAGSRDLSDLDINSFSFPKPKKLVEFLVKIGIGNNDLTLDFFAGSGTTAHSVMQLNAEDGGNRKFILVQLPEPIDAKKSKAAYDFVKDELGVTPPTIFEITKERIIRAAKQINAELDSKIEKLKNELPTEENKAEITKNLALKTQNSFKIFETTPIWEDYDFKAEKLANAEKLFDDDKLTEADIKALFTTWKTYDGSPLTEPIQEVDLAGYKAYYTKQKLYLMYKGFSTVTLKALLEQIDADANFNPTAIIAFGYYFESKALREIAENIKTYNNKKNIDIDFITRY